MMEIASLTYKIECQNCQFLITDLFLVCNGGKYAILTNITVDGSWWYYWLCIREKW